MAIITPEALFLPVLKDNHHGISSLGSIDHATPFFIN